VSDDRNGGRLDGAHARRVAWGIAARELVNYTHSSGMWDALSQADGEQVEAEAAKVIAMIARKLRVDVVDLRCATSVQGIIELTRR
jgi:hypothetical protein